MILHIGCLPIAINLVSLLQSPSSISFFNLLLLRRATLDSNHLQQSHLPFPFPPPLPNQTPESNTGKVFSAERQPHFLARYIRPIDPKQQVPETDTNDIICVSLVKSHGRVCTTTIVCISVIKISQCQSQEISMSTRTKRDTILQSKLLMSIDKAKIRRNNAWSYLD